MNTPRTPSPLVTYYVTNGCPPLRRECRLLDDTSWSGGWFRFVTFFVTTTTAPIEDIRVAGATTTTRRNCHRDPSGQPKPETLTCYLNNPSEGADVCHLLDDEGVRRAVRTGV